MFLMQINFLAHDDIGMYYASPDKSAKMICRFLFHMLRVELIKMSKPVVDRLDGTSSRQSESIAAEMFSITKSKRLLYKIL